MAGFITLADLPMIREIYGDAIASACQRAPTDATFLAILVQEKNATPLENK